MPTRLTDCEASAPADPRMRLGSMRRMRDWSTEPGEGRRNCRMAPLRCIMHRDGQRVSDKRTLRQKASGTQPPDMVPVATERHVQRHVQEQKAREKG
eukprot:1979792-Rhodomonas_salina.3